VSPEFAPSTVVTEELKAPHPEEELLEPLLDEELACTLLDDELACALLDELACALLDEELGERSKLEEDEDGFTFSRENTMFSDDLFLPILMF
jgi:hypothetical protein